MAEHKQMNITHEEILKSLQLIKGAVDKLEAETFLNPKMSLLKIERELATIDKSIIACRYEITKNGSSIVAIVENILTSELRSKK